MRSPCMQCGKEVSHAFGADPFCTVGCMVDFRESTIEAPINFGAGIESVVPPDAAVVVRKRFSHDPEAATTCTLCKGPIEGHPKFCSPPVPEHDRDWLTFWQSLTPEETAAALRAAPLFVAACKVANLCVNLDCNTGWYEEGPGVPTDAAKEAHAAYEKALANAGLPPA